MLVPTQRIRPRAAREVQPADRLMDRFRRERDPRHFEALYGMTHAALSQWVRWLGRHSGASSAETEEIVQDVFVNIFRYAESFDIERKGGFQSWSRTIAANIVKRRHTRRLRPSCRLQPLSHDTAPAPPSVWHDPPLCAESSEASHELRLVWPLFLAAYAYGFARLSARDRRALELIEIEALSYAQASRVLDVGASNFKMIMLRARRRLHDTMRAVLGPAAATSHARGACELKTSGFVDALGRG